MKKRGKWLPLMSGYYIPPPSFPGRRLTGGQSVVNRSTVWCSKSTVEPPDTGLFVPVSELNLELASAEVSLDWTFNNEP